MTRPVVQIEVSPETIERIAMKAAELQGMSAVAWRLLSDEKRLGFERGVANVLGAMTALGWGIVPPENMPDDFAERLTAMRTA